MKMQVIIEFDVKELDPDDVDEPGLERLGTMAADRVCDLVQIGFMNLLGMYDFYELNVGEYFHRRLQNHMPNEYGIAL